MTIDRPSATHLSVHLARFADVGTLSDPVTWLIGVDETADRTSFTRLRPVATHGPWLGSDPLGVVSR